MRSHEVKFVIISCINEVLVIDEADQYFLSSGVTLKRFFHYIGLEYDASLIWDDSIVKETYFNGECGDLIWTLPNAPNNILFYNF